jgi:ABC-2 type transport system permease protein
VPFQVSNKYQASVVNSYFDVLIAYGDQFQVLSLRDLIDVKQTSESDLKVELKNPEYAITSAIRKTLASYQGGGGPFETLQRPVSFTGYLSSDEQLPEQLQQAHAALSAALAEVGKDAAGRFSSSFADPGSSPALAARLTRDFGFRPMVAGLLDAKPFWFYLTVGDGQRTEQIPLPETLDAAGFKQAILGAVKRFSPGFLKTVAVLAPAGTQAFAGLREALSASVRWEDADLKSGQTPADADLLMVLAPHTLEDKQVFAIDQFLMRGGTVMVATAPTEVAIQQSIVGEPVKSGLEDWLGGYGLTVSKGLVLDLQCGALPIPIERNVGGVTVQELALARYPYIVEVRGDGLDGATPITRSLGDIAVPWAAAVTVDQGKNRARRVSALLRSSAQSWMSESPDLLPDYQHYPDLGFAPGAGRKPATLAVMLEGGFDSAFKDRKSPLLDAPPATPPTPAAPATPAAPGHPAAPAAAPKPEQGGFDSVIQHSPSSARLILVASNSVFTDQASNLISEALGSRYTRPVEFAQNVVDWSLEDQGLLAIRSRDQFARTLKPLERHSEQTIEFGNYAAALGGLGLVWFANRQRRRRAAARWTALLGRA